MTAPKLASNAVASPNPSINVETSSSWSSRATQPNEPRDGFVSAGGATAICSLRYFAATSDE